MSTCRFLAVAAVLSPLAVVAGQDASAPGKSVEQIAALAKKSLAVILSDSRDGKQQGLGTGFVISSDGLIATNLHVIGEARPISVQLADGKRHEVVAIHASDRSMDLALIRIAAKNLAALELGDSTTVNPGQPIVAVGHPRGLKNSVVSGVLSGKRDIDGMSMLQLAIPIETGNSGGPVLDMQGKVLGIVTMKSLVTANLGFAVPSSALKPLLAKPNSIPMDRWLALGALDKAEWQTVFSGRWRQRSGRIIADGMGNSFGGRTLCLSQKPAPKGVYEVGVQVRLAEESGAAGLVFQADGGDRHYGFYPTNGKLRFTRFEGPDVNSWKILDELRTPHYKPGEWNHLKVRVEKAKMLCYVNGQKVLEIDDGGLTEGAAGLCKFREPAAEFKQFQIGQQIAATGVSAETESRVRKSLAKLPFDKPYSQEAIEKLVPDAGTAALVLREKAHQLSEQAEQLRKLAQAVHHEHALRRLTAALQGTEKDIDLTRAALRVAALDSEDLDEEAYVKEFDRLARDAAAGLPKNADEKTKLEALTRFLFQERGFHGSRVDYYTRPNSYLNQVVEDREGLPITLSVLYMEVARRMGLNVVGVALPAHFVVRHEPQKGPTQLVDVFEGGKFISEDEADAIVRKFTGEPLRKEHLKAVSKQTIIVRMLNNLKNVAGAEEDVEGVLSYVDAILSVEPHSHQDRWLRAQGRFQTNRREAALADCEWLLEHSPPGIPLNRVRELRQLLLKDQK